MTKPYIVAIAGGTCSGKSTLTEMLKQEFSDCSYQGFLMDDYFKEQALTTIALITGKEYPEYNHLAALELERLY